MKLTSKTGLMASPTKSTTKLCYKKKNSIELQAVARPAPFILKPLSGLFNPFPGQCSLLCNHPVDAHSKILLKKAKESWTHENAKCALTSHREVFGTEFDTSDVEKGSNLGFERVVMVPEELFRRYTDTDSRPLTPAPTLASAGTHASGSRRCVTPEGAPRRPRARLILNLRKSHSQETISYSASLNEPPLIRIQHAPTKLSRTETDCSRNTGTNCHHVPLPSPREGKLLEKRQHNVPAIHIDEIHSQPIQSEQQKTEQDEISVVEDDITTRCGKKRKKKGRDRSSGPPGFESQLDPETQVGTVEIDSKGQTARTLSATAIDQTNIDQGDTTVPPASAKKILKKELQVDSYLDMDIIRQLKRELNEEIVDMELDFKRHKALQEALKGVLKDGSICKELATLQDKLKLKPINSDLWLTMPRSFSRSSARFELPMNGSALIGMTPLDYVRNHISISTSRKLLYNCIFNKFKMEAELENEHERKMSAKMMDDALALVMGRPLSNKEFEEFSNLVGWNDYEMFDFRTFCGVAALCERIFAPYFSPKLPSRKEDPCHEIETADFNSMSRKLQGRQIDERLERILNDIRTL